MHPFTLKGFFDILQHPFHSEFVGLENQWPLSLRVRVPSVAP
jgi:hypothetical protein